LTVILKMPRVKLGKMAPSPPSAMLRGLRGPWVGAVAWLVAKLGKPSQGEKMKRLRAASAVLAPRDP
jgi:hypothetical protein